MQTNLDVRSLFLKAYTLQHENQIQEAILLYQDILVQHTNHLDAMRYLGLAYAQMEDMPQAIAWMKRALAIQPSDANLHMNLGNAYKRCGEFDHAIEQYQQALAIDPNYAQAYNNLAGIYAKKDQYHLALQAYRKAVHAEPGFTQAHFNLGLLLLRYHELAAAEIQFNNVFALDPSNTGAQFYLGLLKLQADDLEAAETLFKEVLAIEPHDIDALVNLGVTALKQSREQVAIDYFTQALLLDENNIEARNNLAATFIHFDRYENALMHYDLLIKDDPENIEYLYNIGVAQMGLGHIQDAVTRFEKILRYQNTHFGALSNLAAIEMRAGHRDAACELLKRALQAKPDDQTSRFMLEALTGDHKQLPTCSAYAHDLFNHYAMYYEKHVQDVLNYAIPQRIWEVFCQLDCKKVERGLDLGCGTGLTGLVLRPFCQYLVGVDIAANMLSVAREKQVYDDLVESEIIRFLHQDTARYQLVVVADVLPYLGDLEPIFEAIKPRLGADSLFVFTTEISADEPWKIQKSLRFAHHPDYLQALCDQHGFKVNYQQIITARKQENQDLNVMLSVLALSG